MISVIRLWQPEFIGDPSGMVLRSFELILCECDEITLVAQASNVLAPCLPFETCLVSSSDRPISSFFKMPSQHMLVPSLCCQSLANLYALGLLPLYQARTVWGVSGCWPVTSSKELLLDKELLCRFKQNWAISKRSTQSTRGKGPSGNWSELGNAQFTS